MNKLPLLLTLTILLAIATPCRAQDMFPSQHKDFWHYMINQDLKRADERDERRELLRKRERDEEQKRQEAAERKKLDNLPMLDIDDKREHSGKADKIDQGGDDGKDIHFGWPKSVDDDDTDNKPSIATDILNGS